MRMHSRGGVFGLSVCLSCPPPPPAPGEVRPGSFGTALGRLLTSGHGQAVSPLNFGSPTGQSQSPGQVS